MTERTEESADDYQHILGRNPALETSEIAACAWHDFYPEDRPRSAKWKDEEGNEGYYRYLSNEYHRLLLKAEVRIKELEAMLEAEKGKGLEHKEWWWKGVEKTNIDLHELLTEMGKSRLEMILLMGQMAGALRGVLLTKPEGINLEGVKRILDEYEDFWEREKGK